MLLIQKYSHVRDQASMLKVAITIARNKMWEYLRQSRREAAFLEEPVDQVDIHRELERRQVIDRILPAMLRLPERCRHLLSLKLIHEKGSAEIQTILGANSINTVYTWERRCFKELINILGGTLYVRAD
jgi:RNA polymerase sigma-70 factor (ECF subfamily)